MKISIDKENLKCLLAYISICFFWGTSFLAMRIGVSSIPPLTLGGIRFFTAGFLMVLYAAFKGLKFPSAAKEVKSLTIAGLLMVLGCNGLVLWVSQWAHSGTTSVVMATIPLSIAVVELFLPNRIDIGLKGWLGLFIGFGGVVFLVSSGSKTGSIDVMGSLLLIAASLMWGMGTVYSKKIKPSGSILTNIAIQMLTGGLALLVAGAAAGEIQRISFTKEGLVAAVYMIIFTSIIAHSSYQYLLQKWSAVKAGTYAYVNPVVAVVLGSIVLNEPLTPGIIASSAVILSGVLLVQLSKTRAAIIPETKSVIG